MYSGRGKIGEDNLVQQILEPDARTSASTLYNGNATTTNNYIDTRGFDECLIVLNAGVVAAAGSIAASIVENDTDADTAAAAISGAAFTAVTPANDQAVQVGNIVCKNQKRYLWLKTVQANATETNISAVAILGKADSLPVSQTLVFDVGQ